MELGATVCVSRNPRCHECPLAHWCVSAGEVATPERRTACGRPAFERTTRWLRGRIIERLRALNDDAWATLPPTIGVHDAEADGARGQGRLQDEGMLERRPDGAVRLPSV